MSHVDSLVSKAQTAVTMKGVIQSMTQVIEALDMSLITLPLQCVCSDAKV